MNCSSCGEAAPLRTSRGGRHFASEDCSGSFEDKLIVKLVGYLKSRDVVRVTPDWNADEFGARHAQSVEQKETILQYDVPLTSLAGLVGQHSFPFAVRVPEALPPSVEANNGPNAFAIVYGLEAGIDRLGALKFDVKNKKKIELRNRPVEIVPNTVTIGPETQRIGGCCSKNGSVTIGFEADRRVATFEEPIKLAVVTRNDSKAKIKAMYIELKEDITWEAQGKRDRSTRIIPVITALESQLNSVQHTSEDRQSRGQNPAAIAANARADLKGRLEGGLGMKYEITVPDKFTADVKTANVVISHSLCVRLQMRFFSGSAEVCMPLRVQERTSASGHRAGIAGSDVAPSSLPNGGVVERTQVVLVPDDAVRADMRREVMVGLVP